MLVVIANDLPPAVRGRLKIWFLEPRPNVFISGIKDSLASRVIDYLFEHCPISSGLMIFKSISKPPGYEIRGIGDTKRDIIAISGLQLVIENSL